MTRNLRTKKITKKSQEIFLRQDYNISYYYNYHNHLNCTDQSDNVGNTLKVHFT